MITVGNGKYTITTGDGSSVVAGDGNDTIMTGANSTVTLGNGKHSITAGDGSKIVAGAGNDTIVTGVNSTVTLATESTQSLLEMAATSLQVMAMIQSRPAQTALSRLPMEST